jgi:hypothetical protein
MTTGSATDLRLAIGTICKEPGSQVAVLDLDDALTDHSVVRRLREAHEGGADVVLGAMLGPAKPHKLYHPDFHDARERWGGNVWIPLRAFRKRLFDAIPDEALQPDASWIEHCPTTRR